jgi:hypothetical protein
MSVFNRFQGIFFSPQPTFKALSQKPVWVDALIIIFIATAVFSYLTAPYVNQDSLKAMKDNPKFEEKLGKERYEAALKDMENPSQISLVLRYALFGPLTLVIGLLVSSLFLLIIGRLVSTEGIFAAVFAALLHANFIDKILGNAVRLVLILMRKSAIQTTTSLALLVPHAEYTSNIFIFLSQVDFFQLWMFALLGYGLASIFKITVRKAMVISYSFWVLKSLFNLALVFAFRSLFG